MEVFECIPYFSLPHFNRHSTTSLKGNVVGWFRLVDLDGFDEEKKNFPHLPHTYTYSLLFIIWVMEFMDEVY